MTKYEVLVDRVNAYNALVKAETLDGLSMAGDDVKTAAKAAREEAICKRLCELVALSPAECMAEFFKDRDVSVPMVKNNSDGTKAVGSSTTTIYFPALDTAYWEAKKVWLSSRGGKGYPLMVAIIMDNYARGDAAASGKTDFELPNLDEKARGLKSELVKENPDWAGTSKTKLETQVNELLKAMLPEGFELSAPLRNSDRRALFGSCVTWNIKQKKCSTVSTDVFMEKLIIAANNAAEQCVYKYTSNVKGLKNGVRKTATVKSKGEKEVTAETPETTAPTETPATDTAA